MSPEGSPAAGATDGPEPDPAQPASPAADDADTPPGPATDGAPGDAPRLRHVIRRLLTPARAGLYLSRADLSRLGAALGFPLPALDRRIMLEHLFVAAGPAGLLPRLLDLLAAEADTWIGVYRGWEAAYPHAAPLWIAWRVRAETLRAELVALRAEAAAAAPSTPGG
ncbi:MAG TPA: hypothetical protein VK066_08855 [Chloroflexota bacterium]|nr:hypothetical protein [Chloroflexota bacterium]